MRGLRSALAHYKGLAEQAQAANTPEDSRSAQERLRDHGISVEVGVMRSHDEIELQARRLTAAQLRELADQLDPPVTPYEDDALRIVRCTITLDGITVYHRNLRLLQDEVFTDVAEGPSRLGVSLSWA